MYNILTTRNFDDWFSQLRDRRAKALIQVRIDRMEDGYFGDCKAIGEGVSELRLDYGPGYRLYFKRRGEEVILLLIGGDKSSQNKDIQIAKQLAKEVD